MAKWKKKEEKLSQVGGKVLAFGGTGSGKTTFALSFPKINIIDAEQGAEWYLEDNDNILNIMDTTSATDLQEALDDLNDEDMIGEFDTVVVDSMTKFYENLQHCAYDIVERRTKKQKDKGKDVDTEDLNLSPREWGHIKRWNQQLVTSAILLSTLGKWFVATAHAKDITEEIGSGMNKKTIKVGEKADGDKKIGYDYDIVIRTFVEKDEATGEPHYKAEILKDRTKVTKVGDIIENPSYEIWKDKFESMKKYGQKKVDMTQDIEKDSQHFQSEVEELESMITEFKDTMKTWKKEGKTDDIKTVLGKLKELNITDPTKTTDYQGMKKVMEFIHTL